MVPFWCWQASQLFGHIVRTLDMYLQRTPMLFKVPHILLSSHGLHLLHDTGQSSPIFFTELHVFSSGFISSQNCLFKQVLDATTCLAVGLSLNEVLGLVLGWGVLGWCPKVFVLSVVSKVSQSWIFSSILWLPLAVCRMKRVCI